MNISYHSRQRIRRITATVATVLVIVALVLTTATVWLQRFVIYTDDGAVFSYESTDYGEAQLPQAARPVANVTFSYNTTAFTEHLSQLSGYYVTFEDLANNINNVRNALDDLPAGTPIMVDIKNYRGYFCYDSSVGPQSGLINSTQGNNLVKWLAQCQLYVIARMPALRDWYRVNKTNSTGLKTTAGTLYSDEGENGIGYWMDPANSTVQNYLIDILNELKSKGFDEVVLEDFCFPDSDDIAYDGDKQEALTQCANKLISSCANSSFAISFFSDDPGFSLPEGRCRLYLQVASAEDAQYAWDMATMRDKRRYLVFVAESDDESYHIQNGVLTHLLS